jgi:hypothetical protein
MGLGQIPKVGGRRVGMTAGLTQASLNVRAEEQSLLRDIKRAAFLFRASLIRLSGWLRPARVYVFYLDPALARKAEAIAYTLQQHGICAEIASSLSRHTRLLLAGTTDLWIGLWNSVALELLPERYIFWNGEPTTHSAWQMDADWAGDKEPQAMPRWHESSQRRSDWFEAARRSLGIWGYMRAGETFAQAAGKPFTFVPFGYSRYYEQVFDEVTGGQRAEPDIDVLFFGWTSERRQRVLDELTRRGVNVMNINEHRPVRGSDLERLIARSKIVLGIYGYDDVNTHLPDFARFDLIFANRIFALHERPSEAGSDADFEAHVPVSDYDQIVTNCLHYLAHPEQRQSAAQRTYEWFKSTYALETLIPFDAVRELNRRTFIIA